MIYTAPASTPAATRIVGASATVLLVALLMLALTTASIGIQAERESPVQFVMLDDPNPEPETEIAAPELPKIDITADLVQPMLPQFEFAKEPPAAAPDPAPAPSENANAGEPAPSKGETRTSIILPVKMPAPVPKGPPEVRLAGRSGVTIMKLCVTEDGKVRDAVVAGSSGRSELDLTAINWLRDSRFEPGRIDGVATRMCGKFQFNWRLKGGGNPNG